jgi:hypothetical protein
MRFPGRPVWQKVCLVFFREDLLMKANRAVIIFLCAACCGPAHAACGVIDVMEEGPAGGRALLDPSADWNPSSDWAAKGTLEGEGNDPIPTDAASSDAPRESVVYDSCPDLPPDVVEEETADEDALDDEEEEEEEEEEEPRDDAGGGGGDEPYVLYLSADDSNSQASPAIARWMIGAGRIVPWSVVRVWEFLNYYDMNYRAVSARPAVSAQLRAVDYDSGLYALQIGVVGGHMSAGERPPMNLTFVMDTSGSMEGSPIALEREVLRVVASRLDEGDVVSAVEWDDERSIRLDSYAVAEPSDPVILAMIASLQVGGSTDLHAGLVAGYGLAERNYREGWLNRVILVSDGQANVGITDVDIIADAADDSEGEGIYLVGVGVGVGYNDTLMDEVTDAGKGAYVFIDSPEEAWAMFDGRFLENMQISARDVQVELVLPGVFRMEAFYGEEYSTVPEEVDPQHLAPDDAMVFHQLLRAEDPRRVYADDTVTVNVTYSYSLSGPRRTISTTSTLQDLVKGPCAQMRKADAVVVYAQALMRISVLLEDERPGLALDVCNAALDIVERSARALDDEELFDIAALLEAYRPVVEARGE